jgi:hypothetical protein
MQMVLEVDWGCLDVWWLEGQCFKGRRFDDDGGGFVDGWYLEVRSYVRQEYRRVVLFSP